MAWLWLCLRFVRRLRQAHPEVAVVLEDPSSLEAQVDFFRGPPTFHAQIGRWHRPWVFRIALSCSRHSYEEPLGVRSVHYLIQSIVTNVFTNSRCAP